MAWDSTKSNWNHIGTPATNEKITKDDWNDMVIDQKAHASRHYPDGTDPANAQFFHGVVGDIRSKFTWTDTSPDRTLTLGASFDYYYRGIKRTITSASVQITNTPGLWFIYFNSSNTLTANQTVPSMDTSVIIATVFWNGTKGAVYYEGHTYTRNIQWHQWAHNTIGTRYGSGLTVTTSGSGASATWSSTSGSIYDEDINITIGASSTFTTAHTGRIFYQTGASTYTFDSTLYARPFMWSIGSSLAQFVDSTNSYAITNLAANRYMNVWIYATADINYPIVFIPETIAGNTGYLSVANARLINPPSFTGMGLTAEMKLLYRLVIDGNGVVQTPITADDYRNSSVLPSGGTPSTTASGVSFAPNGWTSTNVQSALEEVYYSPKFGGEVNFQANSAGFTQQTITSATNVTVDWRLGNKATITMGHTITFTFTAPTKACNLIFKLVQDAGGGKTCTWPASVKWSGGTPTLTATGNAIDIVSFYFDGSYYYGTITKNFV